LLSRTRDDPLQRAASSPWLYDLVPTSQSRDCPASGRRAFPAAVNTAWRARSTNRPGIDALLSRSRCDPRERLWAMTRAASRSACLTLAHRRPAHYPRNGTARILSFHTPSLARNAARARGVDAGLPHAVQTARPGSSAGRSGGPSGERASMLSSCALLCYLPLRGSGAEVAGRLRSNTCSATEAAATLCAGLHAGFGTLDCRESRLAVCQRAS
jgi:hypothetical protein